MRRVGIIGAGYIAAHHLKALRALDDVHIVAVCDVIRERAEKLVGNERKIAIFSFRYSCHNSCYIIIYRKSILNSGTRFSELFLFNDGARLH